MTELPSYLSGFLAVFLLTSFVKMLTVLGILRLGLGLQGISFGMVTVVLAFALSLLVAEQHFKESGLFESVFEGSGAFNQNIKEGKIQPFLKRNSDDATLKRLSDMAGRLKQSSELPDSQSDQVGESFPVLLSSFLLSELKEAFELGFILLIPFVVVDLLVTNVLMVLGVTQLSPLIVSLPIKILIFVLVNGWELLSQKLLSGYV